MGYRLREIAPDRSLCQELTLDALRQVIPRETIESILTETGVHAERERKLNMLAVVLLVIVMNLYTHRSIGHVMEKLIQGLRFIWPTDDLTAPRRHTGVVWTADCTLRHPVPHA
jgi:hypothetical protein